MDSTSDRGADANALSPGGMGTAVRLLREQLVDVSKRNRLTNAPVGKGRSKQLDIEDELSDESLRHPLPAQPVVLRKWKLS